MPLRWIDRLSGQFNFAQISNFLKSQTKNVISLLLRPSCSSFSETLFERKINELSTLRYNCNVHRRGSVAQTGHAGPWHTYRQETSASLLLRQGAVDERRLQTARQMRYTWNNIMHSRLFNRKIISWRVYRFNTAALSLAGSNSPYVLELAQLNRAKGGKEQWKRFVSNF